MRSYLAMLVYFLTMREEHMDDELSARTVRRVTNEGEQGPGNNGGKWLICGFFSLGMLVGMICGLSSAAVTLPLMAAVFSLAGGGIMAMLSGLKESETRKIAGAMLCSFCISCFLFLLAGILVREHRWMINRVELNSNSAAILKAGETDTLRLVTGMCANQQYEALSSMVKEK